MKLLFIICSILILICFIPIPIKVSILFNSEDYYIKIYKFFILKKHPKTEKKEESPPDASEAAEDLSKVKKNSLFKFLNKRISPLILYRKIRDNRFKPRVKIKGFFKYSFGDPALTAISYGAFSALAPLLYRGITLLFKAKHFTLPIEPLVDKESSINFKVDCIFYPSIAHIINILIIILKSILETEEDKL